MDYEKEQSRTGAKLVEWELGWKERVKHSPEAKADRMRVLFDLWWSVYTGETVAPEEVWQRAYTRARLYFQKYPSRNICNPKIWKFIFPEKPIEPKQRLPKWIRKATIRILTQSLGEDIRMSKTFGYVVNH